MGAWVTYGLGSENENLPGFVVLISSGVQPNGGKNSLRQRLSAVGLPGRAVPLARATRSCTSPTRRAWTATLRRESLDALRDLNELQAQELGTPRR